jgi:hypothetical protein
VNLTSRANFDRRRCNELRQNPPSDDTLRISAVGAEVVHVGVDSDDVIILRCAVICRVAVRVRVIEVSWPLERRGIIDVQGGVIVGGSTCSRDHITIGSPNNLITLVMKRMRQTSSSLRLVIIARVRRAATSASTFKHTPPSRPRPLYLYPFVNLYLATARR